MALARPGPCASRVPSFSSKYPLKSVNYTAVPIRSTCDAPSKFQAQVSATGPPRVGPIFGFQAHERMLTNQPIPTSSYLTEDSHLTNDHAHASVFHL